MSQTFLDDLKKEVGFVPNLAATMAESPTLIESFVTIRKILARSAFTPIEREAISLAVSFANDCSYCMAAHSTFAKMHGMSDASLASLRAGETPADPRLGALAQYTHHLLANRGHASDEEKAAIAQGGIHERAGARGDRDRRVHDDREFRAQRQRLCDRSGVSVRNVGRAEARPTFYSPNAAYRTIRHRAPCASRIRAASFSCISGVHFVQRS